MSEVLKKHLQELVTALVEDYSLHADEGCPQDEDCECPLPRTIDKAFAEVRRQEDQIATLTAERDDARRLFERVTEDRSRLYAELDALRAAAVKAREALKQQNECQCDDTCPCESQTMIDKAMKALDEALK